MKILILNGPNLNLLGVREPGIYGAQSFESYLTTLRNAFPDVEMEYFQSNIEGETASAPSRLLSLRYIYLMSTRARSSATIP